MERFEIRVCDGFHTFTSIFKTAEMATVQADAEGLYVQMKRMGVDAGRIELRGENDKMAEVWIFTAAQDRAAAKRKTARQEAFRQKMYDAGLDSEHDDLLD